jgi:hypothetical protein
MYVNDFVKYLHTNDDNIYIDGIRITALLFADGIARISQSELGLKQMLKQAFDWSTKWDIKFNAKKVLLSITDQRR